MFQTCLIIGFMEKEGSSSLQFFLRTKSLNKSATYQKMNLLQLLDDAVCRYCVVGSKCTKLLIKEVQVIDFQAPLVLTKEQHACGPWRVGCDVHTSKCKSGKTLDSGHVFYFTAEPIFVGH